MKMCGCCNYKYDEKETKCPMCGSQLIIDEKAAGEIVDEYNKIIEVEIQKRKRIRMFIVICAGVIAISIIFGIVHMVNYFSDPQRKIDRDAKELYEVAVQQIENGNYDEAIETLDEINVSWSNYDKVDEKKTEAVKEQLFYIIAQYEASGDYESIITYINGNIEDISLYDDISSIYEESVRKYKENIIEKVDEHILSDDYISAKSLLATATNIIGSDSEIETKLLEVCRKEVLVTVVNYENEQKFDQAIIHIYDNWDIAENDSEILAKLSICEQKYREYVINSAVSVCEMEGYESAIKIINEAIELLGNDEILIKEREYFESMAPVALVDLKAFHNDYGKKKQVGLSLNDKLGNNYLNCIEYSGGSSWSMGESLTTFEKRDVYVINGEYSIFKAIVFVPENRDSLWDTKISENNKKKGSFTLRIFGDDKLLYQSPVMTTMQYPVEVEIDITDVDQLSFSWATFNDVSAEIGLANAYLYK